MKDISSYFDSDDLIRNSDTGDSCRETATYAMITGIPHGLDKCYTPQGWIRHPHPTDAWHADPKEFSRDQWTALMCFFIMHPASIVTQILLKPTYEAQRLFRAQNNDVISWEYVLYLRAFNKHKWVMTVLDIGLLISVLIRVVKSYIDKNDTADDINTVMMCIAFKQRNPTITAFLARKAYLMYRGGVFGAWQRYYERTEAPPMDELYKQAIKEM